MVALSWYMPQTSFGSWPSKSCLLAQVNRSIPVSATFAVFWSTQSVITVLFLLRISMKNLRTYLSPSPRHGSQSGRRSSLVHANAICPNAVAPGQQNRHSRSSSPSSSVQVYPKRSYSASHSQIFDHNAGRWSPSHTQGSGEISPNSW